MVAGVPHDGRILTGNHACGGFGRALVAPKLEGSVRKDSESKLVDSGAGGEVGVPVDDGCGYLAKPLHAGARLCSGR